MLSFSAKPSAKPVKPSPATIPRMFTPSVPSAVTSPRIKRPTRAMLARSSPSGPCARVRWTMRRTPKCAKRERTRKSKRTLKATATVGTQTMACAKASRRSSSTDLALRGLEEVRQADAADHRQLHARAADAEVEAEEVQLEAVDRARHHAEEAGHGELEARAARRGRDEGAADVVLADRGGGEIDLQLGHRARDPRGEGVRVRPGPQRVGIRVGVVARRLVDAGDQLFHALAALVGVELGHRPKPGRVGLALADDQRAVRPAQPPADALVDSPRHAVGRLDSDPGV